MHPITAVKACIVSVSVLTALAGASAAARATVIDLGPSTLDSTTGKVWLDLNATARLSYGAVLDLLGPSGPYAGYRFASAGEVIEFVTHAGFVLKPTDDPPRVAWESAPGDFPRALSFMQMIGTPGAWYVPQSGSFYSFEVLGYAAPIVAGGFPTIVSMDATGAPTSGQGFARFAVAPGTSGALQPEFYVGSFLVSDVPEPGSAVLLTAGVACLMLRFRRATPASVA